MTIEKRTYLRNIPLGHPRTVSEVEQFTRAIDTHVLGLFIFDRVTVSPETDEIVVTRVMKSGIDSVGREQPPAVLQGYQINEEPVAIRRGPFTTVFSYIDREANE